MGALARILKDSPRRDMLGGGGSRGHAILENSENSSTLKCNLVQSWRLN